MELGGNFETLLQLLVDCDAVECGLCDAVDNNNEKYQSAALACWLDLARKAGIRPMLRLEKVHND